MNKKVFGYIISGGKAIKKLSDDDLYKYDIFFNDYKEQIERFEGIKIKGKIEEQLYKTILGIIMKEGEYDERYHGYLLGHILNKCEEV